MGWGWGVCNNDKPERVRPSTATAAVVEATADEGVGMMVVCVASVHAHSGRVVNGKERDALVLL
jgi:hypothetical protein